MTGEIIFRIASMKLGGTVAQLLERWTCDQQVMGSIPARGKAA